jgi:hypothetical protein
MKTLEDLGYKLTDVVEGVGTYYSKEQSNICIDFFHKGAEKFCFDEFEFGPQPSRFTLDEMKAIVSILDGHQSGHYFDLRIEENDGLKYYVASFPDVPYAEGASKDKWEAIRLACESLTLILEEENK